MQEIKNILSNWIEAQLCNGATFIHVDWDKLISDLSKAEAKEIKLNEPFNLEGKMVKIVEVEQPKKERWFKCLSTRGYDGDNLIVGKLYRHNTTLESCRGALVGIAAKDYPEDWQEVTPDFICQHSGEGFMYGDNSYMVDSTEKDVNPITDEVSERNYTWNGKIAFFHTREDALAWQERNFGKKEEEKIYHYFSKTNPYELRKCKAEGNEGNYFSQTFKTESDCIKARDQWIVENVKLSFEEIGVFLKNWLEDGHKEIGKCFVEYVINKGGK